MTTHDDETAEFVVGYRGGVSFQLAVLEVECGHKMASTLAQQAQEAIRAGREDGLTISIVSAWRSMEEQTRLHENFVKRLPGANPADPPGYSKHQDGTALDLAFANLDERERFAALAVAHGFTRPVPAEKWHFVLTPHSEFI